MINNHFRDTVMFGKVVGELHCFLRVNIMSKEIYMVSWHFEVGSFDGDPYSQKGMNKTELARTYIRMRE